MSRIVLASASPRRRDLLERLGVDIDVAAVAVDETPRPGEPAAATAVRLAREKAQAAPAGDALVVAADTIVVVDGEQLGKPLDDHDAAAMLARLSGRSHEVVTGVAARLGAALVSGTASTTVTFRALDDAEIAGYVATGEPHDKAGAYGIQGRAGRFVTHLGGREDTVVGLPLDLVVELAGRLGVRLPRPD